MSPVKRGMYAGDENLYQYLKEVGTKKPVTASEEVKLAIEIQKGNKKSLNKLVEANLKFVVSVAKNYQNQGLPLTDLINEGNLGLIKAASRFDETKNFKFISYAVWWIRQSILQALAEQSRIVKIPLNRVNDIHATRKSFSKLEQELRRPPNIDELAMSTGMTADQIKTTLGVADRHASLDTPISDDGKGVSRMDLIPSNDTFDSPDESSDLEFLKRAIERTLSSLNDREKRIIKLYYGIDEEVPYTLNEIGDQENITRERVRQIRDRCIEKIQQNSRTESIKEDYRNRI